MPRLGEEYRSPAPFTSYTTSLHPADELRFQQWVTKNKVPFDPAPTADYDMRGFWRGLMTGHPAAHQTPNANDGLMHYPDHWKTPYHESFSAESQWATPQAPQWNEQDQLVDPQGRVRFDERKRTTLGAQPAYVRDPLR